MLATEAITAISLFASAFGVIYVAVNARHRQRMAMIEKGVDAGSLQTFLGLRLGYLGIGAGAGLALGWIADSMIHSGPETDNPAAYFIGLLVCGGISLIIAHRKVAEARKHMAATSTDRPI